MDGTAVNRIAIDDITADEATQQREKIDKEWVQNIADALDAGAEVDPIIAFYDGDTFFIGDGWHRYYAHLGRKMEFINADVRAGGLRKAIEYSLKANAKNLSKPRTNADKKIAVLHALSDSEWSKLPNREISRMCDVSDTFVSNVRKSITANVCTHGDPPSPLAGGPQCQSGNVTTAVTQSKPTTPQPTAPPAVPLDKEDHPLPDTKSIRQAFMVAEDKFDAAINGLSHIKGVVSSIPDTAAIRLNRQIALAEINNARSELDHGRPHSVCPYCGGNPKGTSCEGCKGVGWVTRLTYEGSPKEMKAKLEVR